jgi:hypothetical protein
MPSYTRLIEAIEKFTNRKDAWTRAKYLRAAGLLGRSSIDQEAPDVDAVHAAALLIACAWPGTQTAAVNATRRLWHANAACHAHDPIQRGLRFAPELTRLIDAAAGVRRDEQDILANVQNVTIRRDITRAAINYVGVTRFFGDLQSASHIAGRRQTCHRHGDSAIGDQDARAARGPWS